MRLILSAVGILALMIVPSSTALHNQGCVPTSVDPALYDEVVVLGATYYVVDFDGDGVPEEIWEESNTIEGLQRTSIGLLGTCFPPPPLPCLIIEVDPLPPPETCGHGPDTRVL